MSKKRNTKANNKPTVRSAKAYTSNGESTFRNMLNSRPVLILFLLLFAVLGTWLITSSHALNLKGTPESVDNPARGLVYSGQKEISSGHCNGAFNTDAKDTRGETICSHPDPGPENVDVRERAKHIDADLAALVAEDATKPALAADANITSVVGAADVGTAGSLSSVYPVNWPCVGTGADGYRVQVIYVYASGGVNRISTTRSAFESVARRVNAVFHNSGVATGGVRNVKYVTNSACTLSIPAVAISGNISDASNIRTQLRAKGYSSTYRKYMVEIDGTGSCGWGDLSIDSIPTQDNGNNSGNLFAMIWHSCWNYVEPHELMHTMGAVQIGAPYGTSKFHCYDQHDVMCYNDGSGVPMIQRCTSTTSIWRFDCGSDTYFRAAGATGWLSTHWNTANSRFLSH